MRCIGSSRPGDISTPSLSERDKVHGIVKAAAWRGAGLRCLGQHAKFNMPDPAAEAAGMEEQQEDDGDDRA